MNSVNLRHCFALALTLLILAPALVPLVTSQSLAPDVRLYLSGPSVLGTLRTGTYSATFTDPGNRAWDYKIFITASDTTGASPLIDSPLNGTITPGNNTFSFDITAQQKAGDLEIHINCTTDSLFYNKVQKISVVSPVTLKADVYNPTNVEVMNATAQFFVNGVEIDKQTIPKIGARQSTPVSSEWISVDAKPGWHDSKIIIDLDGDGTVDLVIEERFYIEGESNWVFGISVLAGLIALVVGFALITKRKIK